MYPLNMKHKQGGFAVANDAEEHQALTSHGYEPPFVADEHGSRSVESVRAELDAAGISYDKRWGMDKLIVLLPE